MNSAGLYIHIPFCRHRCGYCDFATYVSSPDVIERYLQALLSEMSRYNGRAVDTLFIGGGTPTALTPPQISTLFDRLSRTFRFSSELEATVEANPESATPDVLAAYRKSGINRLSFGLQAVQNPALRDLDRLHTWEDFLVAFKTARSLGFTNINLDLMFGLPDQTTGDWKEGLEKTLSLSPQHLSLYALKIESGTKFEKAGIRTDDDRQAEMYLLASDALRAAGYRHYEISNFARPGFESRHNLRYWNNDETIGLGLSAASYSNGVRRKNKKGLLAYIEAIEQGRSSVDETTTLSLPDRDRENLMLGLRLDRGVEREKMESLNIPVLKDFIAYGYARNTNDRIVLTPQGWLLSNQLFQHLV